jgi:UDP-glucose 4-epimerase
MMFVHEHSQAVRPRRVVVLGASGVIGSALAPYLEERGIDVLRLTSRNLNLQEKDAGVQLAAMLREHDALVMLAGLPPSVGRDIKTMMHNIDMGFQVWAALARQPVAHIVYISSDAVYPRRIEEVSEGSPVEPDDAYAAMHLVRERLLETMEHVPTAILRVTQVCAPYDRHDAYGPNRFLRTAVRENRIVLFGQGEETRDHIMVEDVAAVIHGCLVHRSRGVLNVVAGRSLSFANVAGLVADHFDPMPRIDHAPRHVPITHRRFDVSAMTQAFPAIRCTSLESGIARILQQTVAAQGS